MAEVCHKPDDIWKLEHKRSNVWLHFLVNRSKKDNLSQAKCVYCGQILTIPNAGTTTSLRFHLLAKIAPVHEGKKPFKCDFCDYNSSQHSNLNRHIASIHEGTKPFKCSTHT